MPPKEEDVTPSETLDALLLVAQAEPEATQKVVQSYDQQDAKERAAVLDRARGHIHGIFGIAGINLVTIDASKAGRTAAYRAKLGDPYRHRTAEAATQALCCALLAKPYLKPAEFSLLVRPWAPHLPEELVSVEGAGSEPPPEAPNRERQVSSKEKAAQERAMARDDRKRQREARREERQAARADQRERQQLPELSEDEIVAAALGVEKVEAIVPKPRRERTAAPGQRGISGDPSQGVRIRYARGSWIVIEAESNKRCHADWFESEELAEAAVKSAGWTLLRVVSRRAA